MCSRGSFLFHLVEAGAVGTSSVPTEAPPEGNDGDVPASLNSHSWGWFLYSFSAQAPKAAAVEIKRMAAAV